jgi:hypothetical protein
VKIQIEQGTCHMHDATPSIVLRQDAHRSALHRKFLYKYAVIAVSSTDIESTHPVVISSLEGHHLASDHLGRTYPALVQAENRQAHGYHAHFLLVLFSPAHRSHPR